MIKRTPEQWRELFSQQAASGLSAQTFWLFASLRGFSKSGHPRRKPIHAQGVRN